VRSQIVRAVIGSVILFGLVGCGTTLTITHAGGNQPASNAGIKLVAGTASAAGAPVQAEDTSSLGQQKASPTVQLTAKNTALGTVVVDSDGLTLYRFDKDSPKPSTTNCTGGCPTTWPPAIIAPGGKVYVDGLATSAVGTVTRPDGSTQLTLGGWPAYRFSGDHAPGDLNGQGVNGTWFAVAPDGKKASTQTQGPATSSATGSGSTTVLTSQQTAQGLVVADGNGQTVYVNTTDSSNPATAKCTGSCVTGFTPVPAANGAINIAGLPSSDLGTVTRPDGTTQLTLVGFPLYTDNADKQPGDTTGVNTKGWFTISLTGNHQGN
jgi:predicted lipoprotein with Yx(FWY)xxD motif